MVHGQDGANLLPGGFQFVGNTLDSFYKSCNKHEYVEDDGDVDDSKQRNQNLGKK